MLINITRNRLANQRDNALPARETLADIGRADWQMREIQLPVTLPKVRGRNKWALGAR